MAGKIPNDKSQIPNKLQIPISNDQKDFVSNLGDWDLFEIWCLPSSLCSMLHALCHTFQHKLRNIHRINRDLFSAGSGQDGPDTLLARSNHCICTRGLDLVNLGLSQCSR